MPLQNLSSLPGGNTTSRYQDYLQQYQDYARDAQGKDPAFQNWQQQRDMFGAQDSDQGPAWGGQDYFQGWYNQQSPDVQRDYNTSYQDVQQQNASSTKGFLGSLAKGIPLAVLGAGAMGAFGGGLEGLFGAPEAAAGGADAATSAAWANGAGLGGDTLSAVGLEGLGEGASGLAMNPAYGYSQMPYRPFDVLGVGQSMGGIAEPALTSTMSPAAAAGGTGVQDFFKGLTDQVREKPLSSLVSGMNTINSIGGLYSAYKQDQDYGNLSGNLMSMFGDDSPYARQLRKELQRRDAASGRRSQYGPRSVELQARLAELNSRNAGTLANIYQQQGVNRDNMIKSGLNIAKGSGAMDWADKLLSPALKNLFGG